MDSKDGPLAADSEQRFEQAIAAYLEDVAQGRRHDPAELLAKYPDLTSELRQFLDDHDRAMQVADSWRSTAGIDVDTPESGAARFNSSTPVGGNSPTKPDAQAVSAVACENLVVQPQRFGDFELLHEIARGGMGIVYKARQVSLNRIVAIKMILHGHLAIGEDIERFQLEARSVASLAHPHIVVVYDVGRVGDQHFFSMEFVEGHSLAQLLRQGAFHSRKAAECVVQVANAIHFAHQNGVVHRDIKPSNVLIDKGGRARVTDFGLAKQVDRSDELTLSGQLMGTPAYMAPEQISQRRGTIGPACDVYGLGVLLYELLTARAPFHGADQFDTLLQVLEREPQPPRRLNADVPRELEMICLKCLEKDPQRRYKSAAEVAGDLMHYLAGDAISLTSPNLLDRMVRTLERSQFDREFHAWSRMIMHLAWISLATHVLIFLNHALRSPYPLGGLIAIRSLEVIGMAVVLWALRGQWYPPRGAPARQLLALWLGYMIGSQALVAVAYLLTPADTAFNDFLAYPPMAVLASLLFMMLGSSYWGYCYLIAGLFLGLAIVMTFWLAAAPLLFGIAWAASLTALSSRLRRFTEPD